MRQKKQTKKGGLSAGKVAAIGAGVAALGTGAYYLLGPNSKKHQKKAAAWMTKMEKEIEKKVITAKNYHDTVDALAANYSKQYKAHAGEIKAFAKQLKAGRKVIKKKTRPVVKPKKKAASR